MTAKDLSGAFVWTSRDEAGIREESDIRRSYGELRAEWQREQRRQRRAKRDFFAWVFVLIGMLAIGVAMFFSAGAS